MTARDEVSNTLSRFAFGFDYDDVEELAACFTADVHVTFTDGEDDGLDAVMANFARRRQAFRERDVMPWHLINNVFVSDGPTPDSLGVRSFFTFFTRARGEPPKPSSLGLYDDVFVPSGAHWLIAARTIRSGGLLGP